MNIQTARQSTLAIRGSSPKAPAAPSADSLALARPAEAAGDLYSPSESASVVGFYRGVSNASGTLLNSSASLAGFLFGCSVAGPILGLPLAVGGFMLGQAANRGVEKLAASLDTARPERTGAVLRAAALGSLAACVDLPNFLASMALVGAGGGGGAALAALSAPGATTESGPGRYYNEFVCGRGR